MRVVEYLRYRASLKGLAGRRRRSRVAEVVELCGLDDVAGRIIGQLSKGYRQRVGLAESMVNEPEILLLDEPSLGLDPNQIRQIRELIKSLAGGHTVLLSTHILSEVQMICRRVLIINKGAIVASDTTENLTGLLKGHKRLIVEARGPAEDIRARISALPEVVRVDGEVLGQWQRLTVECDRDSDIRAETARTICENGWDLRELRYDRQNLEDVFVAMTQGKESR
jgi:ABC-2 type transport system ATP-binding protein